MHFFSFASHHLGATINHDKKYDIIFPSGCWPMPTLPSQLLLLVFHTTSPTWYRKLLRMRQKEKQMSIYVVSFVSSETPHLLCSCAVNSEYDYEKIADFRFPKFPHFRREMKRKCHNWFSSPEAPPGSGPPSQAGGRGGGVSPRV